MGRSGIVAAEDALWLHRQEHGRGTGRGLVLFHALVKAYADSGQRIDQLHSHNPVEEERFFQYVVQGANGHSFWLGRREFVKNGGSKKNPRYWWWAHVHGTNPYRIAPQCGEINCINPAHQAIDDKRDRKQIYQDHTILGALQVWEMKHGRAPSRKLWIRDGMKPSAVLICQRFGNWSNALTLAGMTPPRPDYFTHSPETCIDALRYLKTLLGRWPTGEDYKRCRKELQSEGLPSSGTTVRAHFGSWAKALEAASDS